MYSLTSSHSLPVGSKMNSRSDIKDGRVAGAPSGVQNNDRAVSTTDEVPGKIMSYILNSSSHAYEAGNKQHLVPAGPVGCEESAP